MTAETPSHLSVEDEIVKLTRRVRTLIRDTATSIEPTLQPFGLKVLRLLGADGAIQASVIADRLFVDRSVVSRQARQLEELGLIVLRVDETDGRVRHLELTPLAVERMAHLGKGNQLISGLLVGWSTEDLDQFASYIARMNDAPMFND